MFSYTNVRDGYILAHEYLYWTSVLSHIPFEASKITIDELKSIASKYSSAIPNEYEIVFTNKEEIQLLVEELNILSKLMGGK